MTVTQMTLRQMLEIEEAGDVLDICCPKTSIPLWSTIRTTMLRMLIEQMFYEASLQTSLRNIGAEGIFGKLRVAGTIVRSVVHNGRMLRGSGSPRPIVILATGMRVRSINGKFFNPLCDYFAMERPHETLVVEDLFGWTWPFPRVFPNAMIQTPWRIEAKIRGLVGAGRFKLPARQLIVSVAKRVEAILGMTLSPARIDSLTTTCATYAGSLAWR